MIKYSGYCENEGYGYYEYIVNNFKINENFKVRNFNNQPPVDGYIYDIKKKIDKNKIVLIGAKKINLQNFLDEGFVVSHSLNDCYYITK